MKKTTKAKAKEKPVVAAEPEIYYAIEVFDDGEITALAPCDSVEEAEDEIFNYLTDECDGLGQFIIVKQVKAVRASRTLELTPDNSIQIYVSEPVMPWEDEE